MVHSQVETHIYIQSFKVPSLMSIQGIQSIPDKPVVNNLPAGGISMKLRLQLCFSKVCITTFMESSKCDTLPLQRCKQGAGFIQLNGDHQLDTLFLLRCLCQKNQPRLTCLVLPQIKKNLYQHFSQLGPSKICLQEVNSLHTMHKRITLKIIKDY